MVFSSIIFLFRFLPIFLAIYFLAPKRMKNFILFFGSLIFYAWGEPVYILLMIFSTISDYAHGIWIENSRNRGNEKAAKKYLISSVCINLSMLAFFKYTGVVSLPVGISFYTFQTMSYTIDVYQKKAGVQRNFVAFGTFVTSFPQLIAGPIVKYKDVAKELIERHNKTEDIAAGIKRFMIGLSKKVLLANQIGQVWDEILLLSVAQSSVFTAWLGAVAFGFQIYFDFSGYSDMAIGLGLMLGFHFPENFHYPYLSKSITEFWRRWHISLSSWFKEYVYIPLGGNQKGLKRQIFNILIVWALTGIWHGAGINFLLWGLWFAFFLIVEKMAGESFLRGKVFGHIYTLFVVLISWVIFAITDYSQMFLYLGRMFGIGSSEIINTEGLYLLSENWLLLVMLILGATPLPKKLVIILSEKNKFIFSLLEHFVLAVLFILSVAFIVDASYNPFLYFRF